MIKQLATATLALALLSACQDQDQPIAIDEGGNNAAATDVETLPPSEEAGNAAASGNSASPAGGSQIPLIPAQYHGRWGMTANDCDPKQSEAAKGLVIVDPMTLRFYEATATLLEQRPAAATSFSGNFNFSGEGMNWQKVETLTVTGDTLKRADKDGSFTYKRCA